jgi:hypothetical protein
LRARGKKKASATSTKTPSEGENFCLIMVEGSRLTAVLHP